MGVKDLNLVFSKCSKVNVSKVHEVVIIDGSNLIFQMLMSQLSKLRRNGSIIKQADGKSSVQNQLWREKLSTIADLLTAIRRRLKVAKEEHTYSTYGRGEDVAYCFNDRELGEWFNATREEILKILSSICKEAGLRELYFQRRRYRW